MTQTSKHSAHYFPNFRDPKTHQFLGTFETEEECKEALRNATK
jgi:hypothetical protein